MLNTTIFPGSREEISKVAMETLVLRFVCAVEPVRTFRKLTVVPVQNARTV
ncbi:hypothetical protein DPMN_019646 [Dreissena polymorpha]|uniref:Uncharacterized protein n=1 Tax=Dreissena polymorpha TaxID=45954 RepID=A0A9D4NJN6_DREPO|nr:hypothetical protein DPMN_019646 [Dreissena polymorpha]